MVFKGMDIGTSKPSKDMRESFPHHLIDIISPEQDFDLGLFLEETDRAVKAIREKNKFPLFNLIFFFLSQKDQQRSKYKNIY